MRLSDWLTKLLNSDYIKKLNLSKKTVTSIILVLCIGIFIVIVADSVKDFSDPKSNFQENQLQNLEEDSDISTENYSNYADDMEKKLSKILSKIRNAGSVEVMINLESGTEKVPAKDENISDKITNEKDTEGGTRIINESNTNDKVVFKNMQGGNSEPLIVKEINPEVKGVIVVSEGAKDSKIKLELTEAVMTVLNIPAFRVTVYAME